MAVLQGSDVACARPLFESRPLVWCSRTPRVRVSTPRTTFQTVITESWMTENAAMLSVGA